MTMSRYARPTGIALLDALLLDSRRIFTVAEARAAGYGLGIQGRAVLDLLHALAALHRPMAGCAQA